MGIRRELLETLADEICQIVKKTFPQVIHIKLSIKKMYPPIEHFSGVVGISIDRIF
jgi:dihydroneopterin aldolase